EGVALIEGPVPDILARTDSDLWLCGLKKRSETVRQRASLLEIPIDEEVFRIQALTTSRPRLAALWEARSRLFPDTDHPGLISILERRQKTEEDLILLLSAQLTLFRSCEELVNEAAATPDRAGVRPFDE